VTWRPLHVRDEEEPVSHPAQRQALDRRPDTSGRVRAFRDGRIVRRSSHTDENQALEAVGLRE
jgi:hypothetical protein